jgi:hypothetical protein
MEDGVDNNTGNDPELMRRIDKIEGMLDKGKSQSPSKQSNNDVMSQTVVFEGFGRDGDGQGEMDWLAAKFEELSVKPDATFFKGEFKGMLWARFTNAEVASRTNEKVNKSKLKYKGLEISCKPDAPVEVRAVRSLLLGIRWQLHEWGSLDKKVIKVDVPASTMTVQGKPVASVEIEDCQLKISWLDDTWKEWKELHDSEEVKGLINTGNKRLKDATESKIRELGKGKGKSKAA